MKKNIIIVILILISLSSLVFAIYQQTEAKRQEALAVANAAEAVMQRDAAELARNEAEKQRRMAIVNAMEAERQRDIALEALEKCRKK